MRSEIVSLFGNEASGDLYSGGGSEDDPPLSYAIAHDVNPVQFKFRLKHDGTHFLTFDTEGGRSWDGFNHILEEICKKLGVKMDD